MERTEAGYGRTEPPARWRSLLDRAGLARPEAPVEEPAEPAGEYTGLGARLARQQEAELRVTEQQVPQPASPVSGPGWPPAGPGLPGRIEWQPAQPAAADPLVTALRRDFGKPRVVAFANPKGGVHKTTATVLCAATIGRYAAGA